MDCISCGQGQEQEENHPVALRSRSGEDLLSPPTQSVCHHHHHHHHHHPAFYSLRNAPSPGSLYHRLSQMTVKRKHGPGFCLSFLSYNLVIAEVVSQCVCVCVWKYQERERERERDREIERKGPDEKKRRCTDPCESWSSLLPRRFSSCLLFHRSCSIYGEA